MNGIFKAATLGLACLFALHLPAAGQEELSFYDEFQGSSLNPAFRVLNPDRNRMALTQGEYLLLIPHPDMKNILEYAGDFPENYSVTVRVQEPPRHLYQYVRLRAGGLQNNASTAAYISNYNGRPKLHFGTNRYTDGERGQTIYERSEELTGSPFYLQLVRKGVEYEGFYSGDGVRWTSVGKRVLIGHPANLYLDVAASNVAPETPIKIDSFEITEILD